MKNRLLSSFFCFLFTSLFPLTYCQDISYVTKSFDIRYTTNYNHKVIHYTPNISFRQGNHNVYIGPEYIYISGVIKGDPVDIYQKHNLGINVGYRYYFGETAPGLSFFTQMNFSFYQIKYEVYQHGLPHMTRHKKLIIENIVTGGVNYRLLKKISVFSGLGFGSYNGFFLMIDSFTPSAYIGLEYRLKCSNR